ncbi:MAG: copper chaperone PCu(A)C [Arenicellales bacterium]
MTKRGRVSFLSWLGAFVFLFWASTGALWAHAIEVHEAIVRMVPPGQSVSVAFMTLHNHDSRDRVLVSGRSEVADSVELHNHVMQDGLMKMRRVDAVTLPAGGSVSLKPGGLHIMLIGLTRTLQLGQTVEIDLYFADGERLTLAARVQMPGQEHNHSGASGSGG